MSFDLYVWHENEPITATLAGAKLERWDGGGEDVFAGYHVVNPNAPGYVAPFTLSSESLPKPYDSCRSSGPATRPGSIVTRGDHSDQVHSGSCR